MAIIGAYNALYKPYKNSTLVENDSEVEVKIKKDEISVKIITKLPGIIIFIFGATGLILMIIKIPVRQIVSIRDPISGGIDSNKMQFITLGTSHVPSNQVEKIPILFWWLIKNKGIAKRVNKE